MRVIGRGPVIGAAVAVCPLHGRFELVQRVPHGSRVGEPRGLPCRLLAGVDGRTERGTADAAAQGAGGGVAGGVGPVPAWADGVVTPGRTWEDDTGPASPPRPAGVESSDRR